jgi:MFS family permease
LTTYVGRLVPPNEKTMTLSMGVAVNHIASVTMPLAGGLLWKYLGYQWTFLIGAAAAAASVWVASHVPDRVVPAAQQEDTNIITTPLSGGELD